MTHCLMCLNTQALSSFATRVWVEALVSLLRLGLSPLIVFALMH